MQISLECHAKIARIIVALIPVNLRKSKIWYISFLVVYNQNIRYVNIGGKYYTSESKSKEEKPVANS